ncbi:class I tRNA ligase family protein, partial [Geobacillus stearothermophilus]|uniref:class I tRNA ligase family protein n=1 Tax=Geobacillus stearothermophilus TaxID=1422 RepID=UPI00399CD50A
ALGNVVVPAKVMEQFGADILRLWVASVDYQADVRISDHILKQVSEVYRKIRNTFRFMLGNLFDFDPSENAVPVGELGEVDRYMLAKLNKLIAKVKKAYDSYDFAAVYHEMNHFCTVELSAFYLDMAKDILYIEAADSRARRAVQTVLYETVVALAKLIAPILPHTADEVWEHIPNRRENVESIQLTDMPEPIAIDGEEALLSKWDAFM